MFKFLAFIVILCILFGVEAARSFIFGTFGFIFWIVAGLYVAYLLYSVFRDKRTPEQKEADKKAELAAKERAKGTAQGNAAAIFILALFIIVVGAVIFLSSK